MAEIYTLHWKLFYEGLTGAFRDLRKETDFNDITVMFDDEKFIDTNKTILAACSPVLRNIIKRCSRRQQSHQLLYLSGFSSHLVELIIEFMFHGEIKVKAYDVEAFLKAANKLKVRGLASDEPEQVQPTGLDPAKADEQPTMELKSQPIDLCNDEFNMSTDVEDDLLMEQSPKPSDDNTEFDTKESDVSNEDTKPTTEEDLSHCYNGTNYKCSNCEKTFPKEKSLRRHREMFHDIGVTWKCKYCEKSFRIKNTMNAHVWRLHKKNEDGTIVNEVKKEPLDVSSDPPDYKVTVADKYPCSQCPKTFPSQKSLNSHEEYYHAKPGVQHDCGICDRTFNTKNSRSSHRFQNHTKDERHALKEAKRQTKIEESDDEEKVDTSGKHFLYFIVGFA